MCEDEKISKHRGKEFNVKGTPSPPTITCVIGLEVGERINVTSV